MKLFEWWKNKRLIIAPKNKIIYRADFKITKIQRRELRRFMRANGIFGAVITDVNPPKEIIKNIMYSYEWSKLYKEKKAGQV